MSNVIISKLNGGDYCFTAFANHCVRTFFLHLTSAITANVFIQQREGNGAKNGKLAITHHHVCIGNFCRLYMRFVHTRAAMNPQYNMHACR